jgi:hypothetical protein
MSNSLVDNPFFFDTSRIDKKYAEGYYQAIYAVRCKLSSMYPEPPEVRQYTEFLVEELQKIEKANNITYE